MVVKLRAQKEAQEMSDILVRIFVEEFAYLDPKSGFEQPALGHPSRAEVRSRLVEIWRDYNLFAPDKVSSNNLYVKFVYEPDTFASDKITFVSDSTIGSKLFVPGSESDEKTAEFQAVAKADLSKFLGVEVCFWHRWVKGRFS